MKNRQLSKGTFLLAVAALAVSAFFTIYSFLVAPDIKYAPPSVNAGVKQTDTSPTVLSESSLGIAFSYPAWKFSGTPKVTTYDPRKACLNVGCDYEPLSIGSIELGGAQDQEWLRVRVYIAPVSIEDFIAKENGGSVGDYGGLKYLDSATYVGPLLGNGALDGAEASEYRMFANGHAYYFVHGISDDKGETLDDDWLLDSLVFTNPSE